MARLPKGAILFLAGALVLSTPLAAQVISDNSIPSGSPLDPGQRAAATAATTSTPDASASRSAGNATQAYEPAKIDSSSSTTSSGLRNASDGSVDDQLLRMKPPAKPGEFETWLQQITGRKISRFGSSLLVPSARDFATPATSSIPPDYALNVGDTISVSLTGSVEGSANFEIQRDGRIFLPNVGSVSLVGVRYRDLKNRIAQAIGLKYRGYDVTVSIQKLRGIRVYITGFANNPGAYTVSSLSTLVNGILAAGGPSTGGSFRSVKLYRNGREVTDFDLYELLRKGDRSRDPLLQNEDVLFIGPVDKQVAVIGSVNEEAIYEVRPGESVEDMLRIAGGPTTVADTDRVILYRMSDRDTVGSRQLTREAASRELVEKGDIIQLLPLGTLVRPLERQQVIVRLEGEVNKPGNYYVPPGTHLSEVVKMAGGLTARAFPFGTRFSRVSVRAQQMRSFREAVDQMETVLAIAPLNSDRTVDASERQSQLTAARSFIDKLRGSEPDGRLVIDIAPTMTELPGDIELENNDAIVVPPRVDTVGVFGAVYRPASFLLSQSGNTRVKDFIENAGGPIRGADRNNIFVVRANGSVLTRARGALGARVLPGDTVFVPVKTQSSSVLAKIRDISQILFQVGLSAAAVAAIK